MGYAGAFLKKHGQICTIQRSPTITSYVSLKRSNQGADPAIRDALWQGMILAASSLVSGELFTIGSDTYLTQTAVLDPVHGELICFVVKCNATFTHQRYTEAMDSDRNIVQSWDTLGTSAAWGQIVTAKLRAEEPGLVDSARYVFQAPASLGVTALDRIVYGGTNYQVESVDDIAMAGVVRVQLSVDTRP